MNKKDESSLPEGLILKGVGGRYSIYLPDGSIIEAKPRGILRLSGKSPFPGDRVKCSESGDPSVPYCIDEILLRRNFLVRPSIANVDLAIITTSAIDPVPDYYFIEKMLILCKYSGIETMICVTKADLDPECAGRVRNIYEKVGYKVAVIGNSIEYGCVIDEIRSAIYGKTITFAGQSGVGKSTVFNKVLGIDYMAIGITSVKNRRGKHTTRHSEIIPLGSTFIADTPGFSTIELTDIGIPGEIVQMAYPEIDKYSAQCKFAGCKHSGDKGCAVSEETVDTGRLERYRFFRKQADSVKHYDTIKKKSEGNV